MKIYLTEFAVKKKDLLNTFTSRSYPFIEHILCLYFLPNHQSFNHWKQEIYNFYSNCDKLKSSKKLPSASEIYTAIWDHVEDFFYERFDFYMINLEDKEEVQLEWSDEDRDNCYELITEYVKWLSNNLSSCGYVLRKDVYAKLDDLLTRYST